MLFSIVSCRSISSFDNNFALKLVGIVFVNRFLNSTRYEEIAFLLKEKIGIINFSLNSLGVSLESSIVEHVSFGIIDINTIGVINSRVILYDGNNLTSVLLEEVGSVIADISKTLNNNVLSCDSFGESSSFAETSDVEKISSTVINSKSSGFSSSLNTTL